MDVSRANVWFRKPNGGATAAAAIAIGLGAAVLIAVFVGLYVANGCILCGL